ncbi:hypothetical protein [Acidipila sp. EB88]|uniref:hypothetical protein n=1 Tax=Acidipila sp. EB88 TaxID=2305226 RepID=UPI000F5E6153|nr:hypothetical protein [Acidipila sp. EB88]RRA49393.1 hypothetical protein D1Y84_15000 [Acidipila sp. EB88]
MDHPKLFFLRRPLPLLLLFTALFTFLIQSGELGTSDTTHRLQVAHALWTGEPQVAAAEYPEFGLHGRGGQVYAWYGIGQSLLLLPMDLVGSAASHLPAWRDYVASQADPAIRSILVSCATNIFVNVMTARVAYWFLGLLGFSVLEAAAGSIALLCATTHLHYAQNMTENNYILLLTLAGFALQFRWWQSGDKRVLGWGAAALGLNLLTRLTTILDLCAAAWFLVLLEVWARRGDQQAHASGRVSAGRRPRELARVYLRTVLPIYAVFALLDRLYQYVRFGSWTSTYVALFGQEQRRLDSSLPASFPFDGHWLQGGLGSGLLGPLFAPEKSVFLFDPLLLLALVLLPVLWQRLDAAWKACALATLSLLVVYIVFYARYRWWAGDFAWGDRYVASAVEFATLLAVPLLVRFWSSLGRGVRALGAVLVAGSVVVQCASLMFWVPLEIYQMEQFGHPTFVIALRIRNIAAQALGLQAAWGLRTPAMFEDPWDAAHITTWNFLPSLLGHVGVAPMWAVHVLDGVWAAVAAATVAVAVRLLRVLRAQRPDAAGA